VIVSIRGTHGSGKSTIVKKIIERYKGMALSPNVKGRCEGYMMDLPGVGTLAVIGSYHNACGGCDGIQPYSLILDRIREYAHHSNHVLFEGALVSSSYGSVGHLMNEYSPDSTFAFLDTPVEECLRRIKERRAAKGNFEPLNPKNTVVKHDNVHRTKAQMLKLGSSVRIVDIDHTKAVKGVMALFGVKLAKEPT
jgi:thymidylate kinase